MRAIRTWLANMCIAKAEGWGHLYTMEMTCQMAARMHGDELGEREFGSFAQRSKRAMERWRRWARKVEP